VSGAEAALESAVLSVLAADAGVQAVLGAPMRVMGPSLRPAYPYLEVARHECASADAACVEASEHKMDLAIVAREESEARDGLAAVRAALRNAVLEMVGFRCVLLAPAFSDVVRTKYNGGRAILRLKAVVEVV
jgi:hypothetical protein